MFKDPKITWKDVVNAPSIEGQLAKLKESVNWVVEFLAGGSQGEGLVQAMAKAEKSRRERISLVLLTFLAAIIGSSLSGLVVNYLSYKFGISK